MIYFAYGSNMSLRRLRRRVPAAEVIGTAALAGHTLRFHKAGRDGSAKCDAFFTGSRRDTIHGVVFRIDAAGKRALDRVEGLGAGYDEHRVTLSTGSRDTLEAFTYIATDLNPRLLPFHWYKAHVLAGAHYAGLPAHYLQRIQAVRAVPDRDRRRHAREMAVHGRSLRQWLGTRLA